MGTDPSFVVAFAGHVDHGKTTLVHSLTGVDTDRLPEEKRRGISIELGFAPLTLPDGGRVSIVDVPGHRRFVPTMIAGSSGIDLVVLVVAADEGVMPQTREHADVCALLGIPRAIVVLTKIDRVDEEIVALAEAEAVTLIGDRFDHVTVRCSAATGDGIESLRHALANSLRDVAPRDQGPPWMWIDRVLTVRGAGAVARGTLVRGRVAKGDFVFVNGRSTRVRGLHVHGAPVTEARAPTRLAMQLADGDVARGELVSASPVPLTSRIDASVTGATFKRGVEVTLHVGTASSPARVTRADALTEREQLVRIVLERALPIAPSERVLLRGGVLGGGVVLDARPLRVAPRDRIAIARAIHAADARGALERLVAAVSPRPLDLRSLAIAVQLEPGREHVVSADGVVHRATIRDLARRARDRVTAHLREAPLDRGMPLAALRSELARISSDAVAELAIRAARAKTSEDDGGAIVIDGDVVLPGRAVMPPEVAAEVARVEKLLAEAGFHGLSSGFLTETLGLAPARARAVLAALERDAKAVRSGDLWFARAVVDDVTKRVLDHLASARTITIADTKALCGLPRRQAISILEHLDATGITRRHGDTRVLA